MRCDTYEVMLCLFNVSVTDYNTTTRSNRPFMHVSITQLHLYLISNVLRFYSVINDCLLNK